MNLNYLIVEVNAESFKKMLLDEGIWKLSEYPDYYYRVDPPRPEMKMQRHIHIAHKKHLSSTTNQVSWNKDQTRHDRSSFASHFKGIEKAKIIAKGVLKLGDDAVLESVSTDEKAKWLVESALEENHLSASGFLDMPILILRPKSITRLKRAVDILETMQKDKKRSR